MLLLMNSAMMPAPGTYHARRVTLDEWAQTVRAATPAGRRSYIGYPQNAAYLAALLGTTIPINRQAAEIHDGDVMAVMKLGYRVPDPAAKGQAVDPAAFEWWLIQYQE